MDEQKQRTEIAALGEFGLIKALTSQFKNIHSSTIKGVGDDAAVIDTGNKFTLVTTDLLAEGIHFDLMYYPLKHLGYKAVVVNLSDIYAMNGIPKQVTVSFAVSNRFSVEALQELYAGVRYACERYRVDLVGGDTSSSLKGMFISVTAIGEVDKDKVTYRSTAREGDYLCVSGDLGGAYLGLQLLEREKQIYLENPEVQPDLEGQHYLVGRQLKPEARRDIIELFAEKGILPSAMIDISDGLSSDLLHICLQSNVGCRLYEADIPISQEALELAFKFSLDPTTCALSGGEDYELLFTLSREDKTKLEHEWDITVIGDIVKKEHGTKLLTKGGNLYDLTAQGWDAFLKSPRQ
ncbi:MAG: thiamine-monophosphate kinase [Chitinophagales bacterium]|nr:MAG: thiamine-monophosphate kinase [Chitinophagales bacterium]